MSELDEYGLDNYKEAATMQVRIIRCEDDKQDPTMNNYRVNKACQDTGVAGRYCVKIYVRRQAVNQCAPQSCGEQAFAATGGGPRSALDRRGDEA